MKKIPSVKQITKVIEGFAPRALALPGDPVGMQCGEPDRLVRRLMVSLDATLGTVAQAAESKADLLVTHHPLLFEPLTPETMYGPAGRALARAIQENVAVYSAHTNLDASPGGINASLADLLDLEERKFLQAAEAQYAKLVVFVPPGDLEKVKKAAFGAGAGWIGNYSGCSFTAEGVGTFHPEEGSSPFTGRPGSYEKVKEVRLEVVVQNSSLDAVLAAVRKAHPYEEPATDVYEVVSGSPDSGLGISGRLPQRFTVSELAAKLGSRLKGGPFRLVGKKGTSIRKVAVCAGSGVSLMDAAAAAGAQLFITGDVKYHDARRAEDMGMHVLDVGHFAPERYGLIRFGKVLERELAKRGLGVKVAYSKERDPFLPLP